MGEIEKRLRNLELAMSIILVEDDGTLRIPIDIICPSKLAKKQRSDNMGEKTSCEHVSKCWKWNRENRERGQSGMHCPCLFYELIK